MTEWYFAEGQQRQGPFPVTEIRQRFQRGQLTLDTLVWREGMGQWAALRQVVDELGLQTLADASENTASGGFDLRGDYAAIDNGTAPLPGTGALSSPYSAPSAAGGYADTTVVTGGEVVYAGFWKRFAAASIDSMVMIGVLVVVFVVGAMMFGGMTAFMGDLNSPESSPGMMLFIVLGVYGLPTVIQAVYFTMMHASARQATLGKMAVGIKVVRTDGQRLGTGRSLGRWAALFLSYVFSCGLAYIVSGFMAGMTARKQGLHDMIADTLVVDKWAYTDHPDRQRHELGTVTVVVIVLAILAALAYAGLMVMSVVMAARQS